MDLIDEVIENSWYKYNPKLTEVCLYIIKIMDTLPILKDSKKGFSRCWLFQQILHSVHLEVPIGLPYYWYKDGVVVDPETLMLMTRGLIKFRWEDDCPGCQIEKECPCLGNPNNDAYKSVEERLRSL